jgi:hypothetical protein
VLDTQEMLLRNGCALEKISIVDQDDLLWPIGVAELLHGGGHAQHVLCHLAPGQ